MSQEHPTKQELVGLSEQECEKIIEKVITMAEIAAS
jgi:hypothetical protein